MLANSWLLVLCHNPFPMMLALRTHLEFFLFCLKIINFLQKHRKKRQRALIPDGNLFLILKMSINSFLSYVQIITIFLKFARRSRKKRRLSKPHLVIRLLHGYRTDDKSHDVWRKLERNWIHIFWLTGETPQTLSELVQEIEDRFRPHKIAGRKSFLDFRNQVQWLPLKCHIFI